MGAEWDGMKRIGYWSECVETASTFFDVARERSSEVMDSIPSSKYIYTFVVDYAFACELYLKALMMRRNDNRELESGHSLKSLSNCRPKPIERALGLRIYPICGVGHSMALLMSLIKLSRIGDTHLKISSDLSA